MFNTGREAARRLMNEPLPSTADSPSMLHTATLSGLDDRPSAPIAHWWPQPSERKNAHRGPAACRKPASGRPCSQALIASGKNRRLPTMARRSHLLPQTNQPKKTRCDQSAGAANNTGNHLSTGVSVSGSTVNPLTSGGGGVWGRNWQSIPGGTSALNTYNFSGNGLGLDVGGSIQSVWAWGNGSWTGAFHSVNFSVGPFSGSVFWTPGKGGYTGFSFGLGLGLPIPQGAYEKKNYTCKAP